MFYYIVEKLLDKSLNIVSESRIEWVRDFIQNVNKFKPEILKDNRKEFFRLAQYLIECNESNKEVELFFKKAFYFLKKDGKISASTLKIIDYLNDDILDIILNMRRKIPITNENSFFDITSYDWNIARNNIARLENFGFNIKLPSSMLPSDGGIQLIDASDAKNLKIEIEIPITIKEIYKIWDSML